MDLAFDPPSTRKRMAYVRVACLATCFALVAGCATPPAAPPVTPPLPPTAPPTPPAPPAPPPPVTLTPDEVKQALEHVRNFLDFGQQEAAVGELQRVIDSDPGNAKGQSFLHQIQDDPVALYGKESFPYRVAPGDSLASIAQRYLNDRDQFYGLARYNGIKQPRQLGAGISINIPGKARALPAKEPASAPTTPPPSPPPPPPPPPSQTPQDKTAQIEQLTRAARTAMAKQDVCGAITDWQKVLALDPENSNAPYELRKAQDLKARLGHC